MFLRERLEGVVVDLAGGEIQLVRHRVVELAGAVPRGAVGEVVASESDALAVGTFVQSSLGWREAFVAPAESLVVVDADLAPLSTYLGVLGMPPDGGYLVIHNGASVPKDARAACTLAEGDELAIMPPLKGG